MINTTAMRESGPMTCPMVKDRRYGRTKLSTLAILLTARSMGKVDTSFLIVLPTKVSYSTIFSMARVNSLTQRANTKGHFIRGRCKGGVCFSG